MRTLRFIVDGQNIEPDPTCDFSGLFNCKNSNVCAEFVFSSEWNGVTKVAAFWSMLNEEYEPQAINENSTCVIPVEAFTRAAFKVQVLGMKRSTKITTNKLVVLQTGGRR